MNTGIKIFLIIGLLFLGCSDDKDPDNSNPSNSNPDNNNPGDGSTGKWCVFGGEEPRCVEMGAKYNGIYTMTEENCKLQYNYSIEDEKPIGCIDISDNPSNQDGQSCYVTNDGDGDDECALIGTDPRCYVHSVEECQNNYRGSIKTFEWCNANVRKTAGCDTGYCLLLSGDCIMKMPRSECNSSGGIFSENPCSSDFGGDRGYCLLYGTCFEDARQSACNSAGGTFYKNNGCFM